jgi:hypothetical protein
LPDELFFQDRALTHPLVNILNDKRPQPLRSP